MDQEFESLSKQNMAKMKSNKKKFEDDVTSNDNISKTKPQVDQKSGNKYQVITENKKQAESVKHECIVTLTLTV
jgi:hypothetical protein